MARLILKLNPQKHATTHTGRIEALIRYITDPKKATICADFNFMLDGQSLKQQAADMISACHLVDPGHKLKLISHYCISIKTEPEETPPSDSELLHMVERAIPMLGFEGCMTIAAVHHDTKHPHVHFATCRVDEVNEKVVKANWSKLTAQKTALKLGNEFGLEAPTCYTVMHNGKIERKPRGVMGGIRSKALMSEAKTNIASPDRTCREALANLCDQYRDHFKSWKWGDLHRALAMRGIEMRFVKHGETDGGLSFSIDGQTWEKASAACPELSFGRISKTLGGTRYRQARPEIAQILAQARAAQPTQNTKHKSQDTTQLQNTNYNLQNTISAPAAPTPARPPRHRPSETTQKAPSTPSAPLLPPDKAKALYKHHRTASARIKAGCTQKEIAIHTALRIRACGHTVYEAMKIMADDPDIRAALTAAYTPAGTERLKKIIPLITTLRAQEKTTLTPGLTQALQEEEKCRIAKTTQNTPQPSQN